jgi:Flp pilus assembly protein TadB
VLLAAGIAAGALAWLFTGWVVLAVAVPCAVLAAPHLLGGTGRARRDIARLEAVEEWVRGLASRLSAGITLEQALVATAATAPAAIAPDVRRLAARLRHGEHAPDALRALADDLSGWSSDQVVAQLLLTHQRRGPGAARALTRLAEWTAEEVVHLRTVEADRARPRFTARAVAGIAVGAFALLAMTGEYMEPYASMTGQVVLAGILAAFGAALLWMRRITTPEAQPRLLTAEGRGR